MPALGGYECFLEGDDFGELVFEGRYNARPEADGAPAAVGFGGLETVPASGELDHLVGYLDGGGCPVDIIGVEAEQFGLAHSGGECQAIERLNVRIERDQESIDLIFIPDAHLFFLRARNFHFVGRVGRDQSEIDGMFEGAVQHGVSDFDCALTHIIREEGGVEVLDDRRGEIFEGEGTQTGLDVDADHDSVLILRGGAQTSLFDGVPGIDVV